MTTIKEIASLAGVSRGTVDRVLNSRGSVNPDTAARIKELIRALDYQPNKAGVALAAQKKKLKIGVILSGEGNPYFEEVAQGVMSKDEELAGYGCTILTRMVRLKASSQIRAIDALVEDGIHGLVLTPYNAPSIADKINELAKAGIPTVTTNTDIDGSKRIAYVGSNYYLCGRTAAGLFNLITSGNVNIGIITGSSNVLCHTERIKGLSESIEKDYSNIHICEIAENNDDEIESFSVTKLLLEEHPEINALFFAAAGVHGGCKAVLSLNRQDSIKIICFDTVDTTKELLRKGIIAATICQEPFKQGAWPVDILFEYLTTGEQPDKLYHFVDVSIKIKENL